VDYIDFNQALDKSLVEVERAFTFISKKSAGEEIQSEEVEKILKQIEDNKKKKEENEWQYITPTYEEMYEYFVNNYNEKNKQEDELVPKKRIVKKVIARET
jgi:hypothetical protein